MCFRRHGNSANTLKKYHYFNILFLFRITCRLTDGAAAPPAQAIQPLRNLSDARSGNTNLTSRYSPCQKTPRNK